MTAQSAMEAGRRMAESLMVDSCTVRRRTGETTDVNTGAVTPTYSVVLTGQKCRVQSRGYWGEAKDIGEAARVLISLEVQFPITVTDLIVRDEITIDVASFDPELAGVVLRIKDLTQKTHATSRRVLCTEVTG